MPMYEYTCSHCGADFEELVSSTTPDREVECPECEREGCAQRKLSTFATGSGLSGFGGGGAVSPPSSGFS